MSFPFVIDNLNRRLADALSELLEQSVDRPFDIATAYFSISSYRIVKDGLHKLGAFRLLLGTDQQSGVDLGLKVQGGSSPGRRREDLNAPRQGFHRWWRKAPQEGFCLIPVSGVIVTGLKARGGRTNS